MRRAVLPGCGSSADADELTFWNGFTGGDAPTMLAITTPCRRSIPRRARMVSVRWEDYYQKVYGVSYAVADHPAGPYREPGTGPVVLRTRPGVVLGPGHTPSSRARAAG